MQMDYNLQWKNIWDYRQKFLNGFMVTIYISIASLVLSMLLGMLFGIGQKSRIIPLRIFSRIYIELIRGTPLLIQILIFYYVIANSMGWENRYIVGVVIMSIFAGAYIAEIVRSGIESVGKSQLEAAKSIGLSHRQTYIYIIFPQVIKNILPPLAGQFASLIKDSSLLSIIAIKEFTLAAREVNADTFSTIESYMPLAIGYLMLTIPISYITKYLERKYKYET
jgi:polar amino acid transport system permease protein